MNKTSLLSISLLFPFACAAPIDPVPEPSAQIAPASTAGAETSVAREGETPTEALLTADEVWPKRPPITSERWQLGARVALAGTSRRCEARRWDEWIRIECDSWSSVVQQLAGPVAGVELSGRDSEARRFVLFPTRGREQRVFQLAGLSGGWRMAWSTWVDAIVSVDWEEGSSDPVIVIQ